MSPLVGRLHDRYVMSRRVRVLAEHLSSRIPHGARVLDVGSGDGAIAACIFRSRPDIRVHGVDVLVRPLTAIPTVQYDGTHLPFADRSVDIVMLVDVLHHSDDPVALLSEAARVARRGLLIKDHLADSLGSVPLLRLMDWVGNARHGVALPYRYLSRADWRAAFDHSGLAATEWREGLGIYPWPTSLVFGGSLQMLVAATPREVAKS